jgi:hypothetical protein
MRIPDPGVKRALDPGSATLLGEEYTMVYLGMRVHESEDLPGQLQLDVQLSQVEMVAQRQQALHTVYTRHMIKLDFQ